MKIIVTGYKGQLGTDLMSELLKRGHNAVGTDIDTLDITDRQAVIDYLTSERPDAVIHCAAYTAVDKAEDNVDLCRKINAFGTKNIAEGCKKCGAKMILISTDYVFGGEGTRPWQPDDPKDPLNIYGLTKSEGEDFVREILNNYYIVRTSWVFGKYGGNFIKTMLKLSETHDTLTVVNDQIGSPTYTKDLSVLLADMAESDRYGIYHASNEGLCSWYDFACEIFREAGKKVAVSPVSSDKYQSRAKRPHNSRMDKSKLTENGFNRLPTWQDALGRYLKELEEK
jgi:dTDP-4-dehydrorhamnose reductase